ncbi:hypothetical protein HY224_00730 [Candidatus Uhrbacteria bacterium]|nr:hypothetical protein [Candidatus Uhrbacteria bacterium]
MAATIMVLGVLSVPMIHLLGENRAGQQVALTRLNLATIQSALQRYQNENGYYPCPAPLNTKSSDPAFGKGSCTPTPAVPSGSNGKIYPLNGSSGTPGDVLLGTVPVRDLKIDDQATLDGWYSLIIYAVTTNLAKDRATYKVNMNPAAIPPVNNAAITIKGNDSPTVSGSVTITNNAPYVLISPGPDRKGAYSAESGQLAHNCDKGAVDTVNCFFEKYGGGFCCGFSLAPLVSEGATFVYSPLNRSTTTDDILPGVGCDAVNNPGACHYDDMVTFVGNGTACAVGQVIANVNEDGSYVCQNALVAADIRNTAEPVGTNPPSRSGGVGANTLDTLTCPFGQAVAGVRKDGSPFCAAGQVQNGVLAQGTVGGGCGTAGQLAMDPAAGDLISCTDTTVSSQLQNVLCDGSLPGSLKFNAGALSFNQWGGIYICRN